MIKSIAKFFKSVIKTILVIVANIYKEYKYRALIIDKNGNVYYCNYRDADMLLKHRNLEYAYDLTRELAYCGLIKHCNPRYVDRVIAVKYPKYFIKVKEKKVPVYYKVKKALKAFSKNFKRKMHKLFFTPSI